MSTYLAVSYTHLPRYIDIFKLKYDYHNAKAILKAAAMGTSPDRMLMDCLLYTSNAVKKITGVNFHSCDFFNTMQTKID